MTKHPASLTGYIYDDSLRVEANRNGRNYWYAYLPEIFDEMGLRATELSIRNVEEASALAPFKYLFVGSIELSESQQDVLREWVAGGGVLIGFALRGADGLFGIRHHASKAQPDDEFTISGYGSFPKPSSPSQASTLNPHYDYQSVLLPIFSPLELVTAEDSQSVETAATCHN